MTFITTLLKTIDVELLFTDRDSLTYEIKSDVYEDFFKHKHLFDLSNYPKDSKFFDTVNEGAISKTKLLNIAQQKSNQTQNEKNSKQKTQNWNIWSQQNIIMFWW